MTIAAGRVLSYGRAPEFCKILILLAQVPATPVPCRSAGGLIQATAVEKARQNLLIF